MTELGEELAPVFTDGGIEAYVGVLGGGPVDGEDDRVSVRVLNPVVTVNEPRCKPVVIVNMEK